MKCPASEMSEAGLPAEEEDAGSQRRRTYDSSDVRWSDKYP
jgi:hypothetical protein